MNTGTNEERQIADSKMEAMLAPTQLPLGMVIPYGGDITPRNLERLAKSGWLYCDGHTISRSEYKDLFSVIGDIHGAGDFITTFNLPDYRGRFLRGADLGSGRDPDADKRQPAAPGGRAGNVIGSVQGDSFKAHSHWTVQMFHNNDIDGVDSAVTHSYEHRNARTQTEQEGERETRPINASVAWLMLARGS